MPLDVPLFLFLKGKWHRKEIGALLEIVASWCFVFLFFPQDQHFYELPDLESDTEYFVEVGIK